MELPPEINEQIMAAQEAGQLGYKVVCTNDASKECEPIMAILKLEGKNNEAERRRIFRPARPTAPMQTNSKESGPVKYRSECATPIAFMKFTTDFEFLKDVTKAYSSYDRSFEYEIGKRKCVLNFDTNLFVAWSQNIGSKLSA
jgi:hypothetical protein